MPTNLEILMSNPGETIAAIAALGTSAYGLVDTAKIFWNSIARVGFARIERTLEPFEPALANAMGPNWANAVFSHWLNGVPLDEQKLKTKSLIRLGLTPDNARELANAGVKDTSRYFDPKPTGVGTKRYEENVSDQPRRGSIDPAAFQRTVAKLYDGTDLGQADINLLGRFDATVEAALDAAYERADREYANAARGFAGLFALVLAVIGGYLVSGSWIEDLVPAIVVGIIAVPLAPIAKDLSTGLANAVSAMSKVTAGKS